MDGAALASENYGLGSSVRKTPSKWRTPDSNDSGVYSARSDFSTDSSGGTPRRRYQLASRHGETAHDSTSGDRCSELPEEEDSYVATPLLKASRSRLYRGRHAPYSTPPSATVTRDTTELKTLVGVENETGSVSRIHFSPRKKTTDLECSAEFETATGSISPRKKPKTAAKTLLGKENSPLKLEFEDMFSSCRTLTNRSMKRCIGLTIRMPGYLEGSCFEDDGRVDFLKRLTKESYHPHVAELILGYLGRRDLKRASKVSRLWHDVCSKHLRSRGLTKKRLCKENQRFPLRYLCTPNSNHSVVHGSRFSARLPTSPASSTTTDWFQIYTKEAKKLSKNGKLVPCPRCRHPSRVDEFLRTGQCASQRCSYHFCTRCDCAWHPDTECKFMISSSPKSSPEKTPRKSVWSQSKKALRRLCL